MRRLEESRPLDRLKGGYEDNIFVLYKAKQGSLISVENLKEMKRFAEQLTSDEQWPVFCIRDHKKKIVDGHGCTEESYVNIT